MQIGLASSLTKQDISHCDFSFSISSQVAKPYDCLTSDGDIAVTATATHTKSYDFNEEEFEGIDHIGKRLWVLSHDGVIHGYALASKEHWCNMVSLDEIRLDSSVRGKGYAKQLVQKVIDWCQELGSQAVTVETQTNNVSACHLYRKCGFVFGGYDEYLYCALPRHRHETALFWYYINRSE